MGEAPPKLGESQLARRVFLATLAPAALLPLGFVALGCSKKFTCSGTGLAPTDQENRTRFAYVDHSSDISKMCEDCSHFTPGETCGTCKVLAGPVHPQGTCTLFAQR